MSKLTVRRLVCGLAILWTLDSAGALRAQVGVGTWVRQGHDSAIGVLTMTVEACCNGGRRLIYRVSGRSDVLMTVESPFDGTEVPVLVGGKPSGETMAIKRLDEHHTYTVLKMNGKLFGTSKATLSADGKTLTVENDMPSGGAGVTGGAKTETWVRK